MDLISLLCVLIVQIDAAKSERDPVTHLALALLALAYKFARAAQTPL